MREKECEIQKWVTWNCMGAANLKWQHFEEVKKKIYMLQLLIYIYIIDYRYFSCLQDLSSRHLQDMEGT